MLKHKIISTLSLLALSVMTANTYALEKNIDFYNGTNRYSVTGAVSEFKDLKFQDNSITLMNGNESTYVTINKESPFSIYYTNQELSFENIINQNKGKSLIYKDKSYTVVGYSYQTLVLSEQSSTPNSNYLFISDLKTFELPQDWVVDYEKGLKATFNTKINPTDQLFYSQLDNNLNYMNTYQLKIIDKEKIKFTHYIDVTNNSNQRYDNVNLSFFIGDMNINNRPPVSYLEKESRVRVQALSVASSDSAPIFEQQDFSNVKVVTMKEPVTIFPNFNRVKYSDDTLNYQLITKIDGIQKIYGDMSDSDILENLNKIKPFKNYLSIIQKDPSVFIPSGKVNVYEELKNNDKLIIETNLNSIQNKPIELLKNTNQDIVITSAIIKTTAKGDSKNKYLEKSISKITLKNKGKEDYLIAKTKNDMSYELIKIKANSEVDITL